MKDSKRALATPSYTPRILLYDIETSPNLAYVWGKYQQDVIAYKDEWQILSVAWKWLGEKNVYCKTLNHYNAKDDKKIVAGIWDLFSKADILVAHNGDAFDQKKVRARFLFHGLPPTKILQSIDTLKVARKYFKFNSNKLDDIGKLLNLGRKEKHKGFDLWLRCLNGEKQAWKQMENYNVQDVVLLEKLYKRLKPWIENHPNIALLTGEGDCPKCGSDDVVRKGIRANAKTIQQQWQCKACVGWFLTSLRAGA